MCATASSYTSDELITAAERLARLIKTEEQTIERLQKQRQELVFELAQRGIGKPPKIEQETPCKETLYTYQDLARHFQVHTKTIYRWFSRQPKVKPTAGTVRISETTVQKFVIKAKHETPKN